MLTLGIIVAVVVILYFVFRSGEEVDSCAVVPTVPTLVTKKKVVRGKKTSK